MQHILWIESILAEDAFEMIESTSASIIGLLNFFCCKLLHVVLSRAEMDVQWTTHKLLNYINIQGTLL
jgi:hypothetical protein